MGRLRKMTDPTWISQTNGCFRYENGRSIFHGLPDYSDLRSPQFGQDRKKNCQKLRWLIFCCILESDVRRLALDIQRGYKENSCHRQCKTRFVQRLELGSSKLATVSSDFSIWFDDVKWRFKDEQYVYAIWGKSRCWYATFQFYLTRQFHYVGYKRGESLLL